MRRFLLSMLTECVNFRFSQEHAGREKFAAALVEIVKRDWPQAWPEFEGTVLQVLERGPVQASVVCKVRGPTARAGDLRAAHPPHRAPAAPQVLRVVLEDVGDSDFNLALPSSRRADITRGLGDMAARGLFAAFERLLHTVISTLSGSPNAETAARFSLAGNEILGVISRFLASSMLSRFRDTRLTAAIAAAMRLPSLAVRPLLPRPLRSVPGLGIISLSFPCAPRRRSRPAAASPHWPRAGAAPRRLMRRRSRASACRTWRPCSPPCLCNRRPSCWTSTRPSPAPSVYSPPPTFPTSSCQAPAPPGTARTTLGARPSCTASCASCSTPAYWSPPSLCPSGSPSQRTRTPPHRCVHEHSAPSHCLQLCL